MTKFAAAMSDKAKKIIKYVASVLIAAFFIWLVVRKIDWKSFAEGLVHTSWGYMVLFVVVSILALVFRAVRWKELLHPLDPGTKAMLTWDATNVGNLANIALPGAGELLRCGFVTTKSATYDKVLGTVMMERIWDVLAILILLATALILKWEAFGPFFMENIFSPASGRLGLWWIILLALALVAALIWAVFHWSGKVKLFGKVADTIKGVFLGLGTFFKMKHKMRFALYTAGVWIMYVLMSYFGLKAIPELSHLGMIDALFISAIGNLASVIPVPSGMGPYHYLVMITLGGLYGCSNELGLLYAVLCHETHAIIIVILGVISYVHLNVRKKN